MKTEIKYQAPDIMGKFGIFGGRFVPETLMSALEQLNALYLEARNDTQFISELEDLQRTYNGARPL
jgi:tryptophan synthase beta chain